MRKTKIMVTIGPQSRDVKTLGELIDAGMDCARLNFSHGTHAEHAEVIRDLRRLSVEHGRTVAILQDLGGIKLRLGKVAQPVRINRGDEVWIVPDATSDQPDVLPFPEPAILRNLKVDDLVYISDGTFCLEVLEKQGLRIRTRVRNGGVITSNKGVNLPGVKVDLPVLTEKDKVDLKFGVEQDVDWVGISFVRTAQDIRDAKAYLEIIGSKALVMAKLEKREGIEPENLEGILKEVHGVMVARGDLGVEIPMEEVPLVQKHIAKRANEAAKTSCIATQMLRSMVDSPTPTRAEVSDIANAVLDGCDSILLSDETAIGHYPVEAVKVADATIRQAEKIYPYFRDYTSRDRTEAIAGAAAGLVKSLHAKPIVLTSTGRAAFEVARFRPDADIIVFSHDPKVLRKVALGWGLAPMGVLKAEQDVPKLVAMIIQAALDSKLVGETDVVTIVHGFLTGVTGTTNTVQVLDVHEYLTSISQAEATQAAAPQPRRTAGTRR
ncbi:MAG: pyruvate kinase [Dehalococcoidia bacterium]|nr:pyruvate kinase [Dehalococcoidia bacterium]MSQ16099.1 pyruvate kinase [Dehalococcoidia bacterium]